MQLCQFAEFLLAQAFGLASATNVRRYMRASAWRERGQRLGRHVAKPRPLPSCNLQNIHLLYIFYISAVAVDLRLVAVPPPVQAMRYRPGQTVPALGHDWTGTRRGSTQGESKGRSMKTSTLRNAISIALLVAASGASDRAAAQDATRDTAAQGRAPMTEAPAGKHPKKPAGTSTTPATTDLPAVTVTGTRIRGGDTPSPVITIGSEQIQQEGFTDLGELIRSVPQNFSGGQNPGVTVGAIQGDPSNQNVTGGSGLNLRGLGPDATLTLLNGRRLSYGGFSQAVDISAIPVEAVERVEIVPDGASAIYGSDAVGGVANVILKRDFDGVTVGARYGGATDGGLITHEYNATAGTAWASGGLIATFKDIDA